MKANKYIYTSVIQQNYGHGWEDNSEYATTSNGKPIEQTTVKATNKEGQPIEKVVSLLSHDLIEYRRTGYATRVIYRKLPNI